MRRRTRTVVAGICIAVLSVTALLYNLSDIGQQTIQLHLNLYGSAIYEYHAQTGRWPTQGDDFAKTSLSRISPQWKQMLNDDVVVIVWHKNLDPNPKRNASVILAYHNKGLLANLGKVWVCWGDLRTEYVNVEILRAALQAEE